LWSGHKEARRSPWTTPPTLSGDEATFVSDRTVGIRSDHVAAALPREFIEALRRGEELVVELEAEIPEGT